MSPYRIPASRAVAGAKKRPWWRTVLWRAWLLIGPSRADRARMARHHRAARCGWCQLFASPPSECRAFDEAHRRHSIYVPIPVTRDE